MVLALTASNGKNIVLEYVWAERAPHLTHAPPILCAVHVINAKNRRIGFRSRHRQACQWDFIHCVRTWYERVVSTTEYSGASRRLSCHLQNFLIKKFKKASMRMSFCLFALQENRFSGAEIVIRYRSLFAVIFVRDVSEYWMVAVFFSLISPDMSPCKRLISMEGRQTDRQHGPVTIADPHIAAGKLTISWQELYTCISAAWHAIRCSITSWWRHTLSSLDPHAPIMVTPRY